MAKRKKPVRRKPIDVMASKAELKWIVLPCLIVLLGTIVYYLWYSNQQLSTNDGIAYIESFMTSSGKLNDFQNKLGVEDISDIKWFEDNKTVEIHFGRIILNWEKEQFYSDVTKQQLNRIGMTYGYDKKNVMHVYYRGQEVEKWIK